MGIFFFFQAEDGIRAPLVTGVQTCALPISVATAVDYRLFLSGMTGGAEMDRLAAMETFVRVIEAGSFSSAAKQLRLRSEERRVGKQWRMGGGEHADVRSE